MTPGGAVVIMLALLLMRPSASWLFGLGNRGSSLPVRLPIKLNRKFGSEPVLTLTEPKTQSRVHLVGVAHGSSSSAALVDNVISTLRPDNVVVELCPERFLSISLEARLRPRFNESMTALYDAKILQLDAQEALLKTQGTVAAAITRFRPIARYVANQGVVAGLFIILGLSVSVLQKLARGGDTVAGVKYNSGGKGGAVGSASARRMAKADEFVTAMLAAEQQDIEVSLGDAPQSDTLNSVKKVFTPDLYSPRQVSEGALLLGFSVLGAGPYDSNKRLGERIPRDLLDRCEWLNIPGTYVSNRKMLQGLAPLMLVSLSALVTLALPLIPGASASPEDALAAASVTASAASSGVPTMGMATSIMSLLTTELPAPVSQAIDSVVDVFSLLLLIRLTKLIGTDRDAIIASKVQDACRRYPGKDIVVVIGMLHANGVARWLLSGEDPRTFLAEPEVGKKS